MNLRYFFHILIALPLIPIIIFQAKKMRKKVPLLPEAEEVEGCIGNNSERSLKVLFLGESSVAGVGVKTHHDSLVGSLCRFLSVELNAEVCWKVYAKSKFNAEKIQRILLPEIIENQTDLIIIGTGGNDGFELTPPGKFLGNIENIIEQMRSKFGEKPVLFVNFPPVKFFPAFPKEMQFVLGTHTDILSSELRKVSQKKSNIHFMDDNQIFTKWADDENLPIDHYFSDGIHPSAETYRKWADEVGSFIFRNKIISKNHL